ncbi:MAG TPA: hypothetical protein VFG66_04515 [Gemmatimonadales bacterium]|nr:hypothetical protein [Gemmatimonadales bacterium]
MQSSPTVTPSLFPLLLLGALALLWQGCGGEDLVAPTTGEIAVTVSTTGDEPDPDGYTLSLDDLDGAVIDGNATRTLTVTEGNHTLELGGLAANCAVQGDSRQSVQVTAGGSATVTFAVVCSATAGGLTVIIATTGDSPDPDGYTVTVDQGEAQPIGDNATLTLAGLAAGGHTVLLSDVAETCTVAGDNPRTVTVPAGGTVELTFAVVCTGSVARWTPMVSGTRADLLDVWGASAADVFAVGELDTPRRVASVIMHYDGSGWSQQLDQTDLELQGVWGSSTADVYAVGFDFDPSTPIARVLHFDGTRWSEIPGFASLDGSEEFTLLSVWGSAASDVFAVGGAFDGRFDRTLIFHFDGSGWRRMSVAGEVLPALNDVWGSSATDVWAVGRDQVADPSAGVILHYDGASWTPVLQHEGLVPNAVWGSSATNVFTVGFQVDETPSGEFTVTGVVWHYDGTAWTPMSLPSAAVLNEVWGTSPTDVFAVGEDGAVLHYDGSAWTVTSPTRSALLAVWGSSPGDVFAAGAGGTILHGTP